LRRGRGREGCFRNISGVPLAGESGGAARRETGEIEPQQQKVFKKHALAGQEDRLRALVDAQSDRTLAELRDALPSAASLSPIWRALDRLGLTV
jgi:hypothetical protein